MPCRFCLEVPTYFNTFMPCEEQLLHYCRWSCENKKMKLVPRWQAVMLLSGMDKFHKYFESVYLAAHKTTVGFLSAFLMKARLRQPQYTASYSKRCYWWSSPNLYLGHKSKYLCFWQVWIAFNLFPLLIRNQASAQYGYGHFYLIFSMNSNFSSTVYHVCDS